MNLGQRDSTCVSAGVRILVVSLENINAEPERVSDERSVQGSHRDCVVAVWRRDANELDESGAVCGWRGCGRRCNVQHLLDPLCPDGLVLLHRSAILPWIWVEALSLKATRGVVVVGDLLGVSGYLLLLSLMFLLHLISSILFDSRVFLSF